MTPTACQTVDPSPTSTATSKDSWTFLPYMDLEMHYIEVLMADHKNSLCRTCFCQLNQIKGHMASPNVQCFHDPTSFVHSDVNWLLKVQDYQSSECVLNRAAKVVANQPKYSHISDSVQETLHWLLWRNRFDSRSSYLDDLHCLRLHLHTTKSFVCHSWVMTGHWSLCSAACEDLLVPCFQALMHAYWAFSCIGPFSWNSLPLHNMYCFNWFSSTAHFLVI